MTTHAALRFSPVRGRIRSLNVDKSEEKAAIDAASSADRLAVGHPLGKGRSGPVLTKSKRDAKRHQDILCKRTTILAIERFTQNALLSGTRRP